jgi:POT family proton-dependent oligopeptide transporter
VYAGAVFGGYVADKVIGYQRSILIGAAFMSAGLFMITMPNQDIFKLGLATIIVGNGMFKPNISTMVGKLYSLGDTRRDSGFTIFYMGINAGAFIAPILTQLLAQQVFASGDVPAYKIVFIASGIGMLISLSGSRSAARRSRASANRSRATSNPMRMVCTWPSARCS